MALALSPKRQDPESRSTAWSPQRRTPAMRDAAVVQQLHPRALAQRQQFGQHLGVLAPPTRGCPDQVQHRLVAKTLMAQATAAAWAGKSARPARRCRRRSDAADAPNAQVQVGEDVQFQGRWAVRRGGYGRVPRSPGSPARPARRRSRPDAGQLLHAPHIVGDGCGTGRA